MRSVCATEFAPDLLRALPQIMSQVLHGGVTCLNTGVSTQHQSNSRGRPGYSREDIIQAAVGEFMSRGYDATTMDQVAATLGISKAALYHHISSKEEILDRVVTQALDRLEAVIEGVDRRELSAGERVKGLIVGSVSVLCERPESITLLLRLRGNSEVETRALERRRQLTRSVIPLFVAAQDSGEIRADVEAPLLVRLVFGVINSVAEWYEVGGRLSAQEISQSVEAVLYTGLNPRP